MSEGMENTEKYVIINIKDLLRLSIINTQRLFES